jgi:NADH-quinone oxidoreductase subunit G
MQSDFGADAQLQGAPWLGTSIASLQALDRVLLVGSTLRHDHPLLALRLRAAVKRGAQLNLINPVDDDLLTRVANKAIVAPRAMVNMLAQVAKALAAAKSAQLPAALQAAVAGVEVSATASAIAASLASGERKAVLLGNLAQHHTQYADLHALAQAIATLSGATFGFMGEAANSVGAYVAGAVPMSGPLGQDAKAGMHAAAMLETPRKAYVLLGVEAELDCYNPIQAVKAMQAADMVVALSAYKHKALDYADVLLPIAPFTETAGTFVNTEGRAQSFNGTVKPLGETRPAWKVLRVLGNLLGLAGFDYDSSEAVRAEIVGKEGGLPLDNELKNAALTSAAVSTAGLQRIGEVPPYQTDAIVRRATSLQQTKDAGAPQAWMNSALLQRLGVAAGAMVALRQEEGHVVLRAGCDDKLPLDCVRVAAGHPMTAGLGAMMGGIEVEKA